MEPLQGRGVTGSDRPNGDYYLVGEAIAPLPSKAFSYAFVANATTITSSPKMPLQPFATNTGHRNRERAGEAVSGLHASRIAILAQLRHVTRQ